MNMSFWCGFVEQTHCWHLPCMLTCMGACGLPRTQCKTQYTLPVFISEAAATCWGKHMCSFKCHFVLFNKHNIITPQHSFTLNECLWLTPEIMQYTSMPHKEESVCVDSNFVYWSLPFYDFLFLFCFVLCFLFCNFFLFFFVFCFFSCFLFRNIFLFRFANSFGRQYAKISVLTDSCSFSILQTATCMYLHAIVTMSAW